MSAFGGVQQHTPRFWQFGFWEWAALIHVTSAILLSCLLAYFWTRTTGPDSLFFFQLSCITILHSGAILDLIQMKNQTPTIIYQL
jgi:hypothetical protein